MLIRTMRQADLDFAAGWGVDQRGAAKQLAGARTRWPAPAMQ